MRVLVIRGGVMKAQVLALLLAGLVGVAGVLYALLPGDASGPGEPATAMAQGEGTPQVWPLGTDRAASATEEPGPDGVKPEPPPAAAPAELAYAVRRGLAQDSTASEAMEAAGELTFCAFQVRMQESMARGGFQGDNVLQDYRHHLSPEEDRYYESKGEFTKEAAERAARVAQAARRRCQGVDAAVLARRGELFRRGYEANPQLGASSYLHYLTLDEAADRADPQLLESLRAEVRRQAESGSVTGLVGWAFAGDASALQLGFSVAEARGYREAYFRLFDDGQAHGSAGSLREQAAQMPPLALPLAVLTAAQQREADAIAQRIVDSVRPPGQAASATPF
jgi:hypothetical protein